MTIQLGKLYRFRGFSQQYLVSLKSFFPAAEQELG
jgi:hypothetical protein